MAIELFNPQLVIARLTSQIPAPALKQAGNAADFAAAVPEARILPAAFVIELANVASRNTLATMGVSQENEVRFGVILAVQNLRDATGEKAQADMRSLREAVMTALLAWAPDPDYAVIEYGGGRVLQLDNLVLWWQDDYITSILARSV